jgi:hypothetical protein
MRQDEPILKLDSTLPASPALYDAWARSGLADDQRNDEEDNCSGNEAVPRSRYRPV